MASISLTSWVSAACAPDQTALGRAGGVAPPCRHGHAAASRLASPPDDGLLGCVQLPFL